jgi:hypothetical protein|tara:strand:+ start:1329 stop:1718 length:390 start_codon:yes stop_codon:yes gene_type:complete
MYFLLILSLKSILGSVIGSSFYNWFQGTTGGIWFQKQVDKFMQHVAVKYNLELAKKDAKFRKQFPLIAQRLDALEERALRNKIALEGICPVILDRLDSMVDRIDSMEEDLTTLWEVNLKEVTKYLEKNK